VRFEELSSMKRSVHVRGQRAVFAAVRLVLVVVVLGGLWATSGSVATAAAKPSLRIKAPRQVAVNQPIELIFQASGVANIAAYETNVSYNPAAAEFDGLSQGNNGIAALGRDVTPVGPVELPNGVSFGLYSCSVGDCRTRTGARQSKGGDGEVLLGLLSITPRQAGTLVLRVSGTKMVDVAGKAFAIAGAEQSITVQVGSGSTKRWAAPALATSTGKAGKATTLDLNRDGLVSFTDVSEAALSWTLNRQGGTRCGTALTGDVNGDGCVDVADLQGIVANYSVASARQRPHPADTQRAGTTATTQAADTSLTFVVNSTSDAADASIGNGVCRTSQGVCTLRAAIAEANAHAGPDTITFGIGGSGIKEIQLGSQLPTLNDMTGGTTINGYTQNGAAPNTDPLRFNAAIRVQLRGNGPSSFNGIVITSPGNSVRGLAFYRMKAGVYLNGVGATDNIVAGNIIGLDASGNNGATGRNDGVIGNVSLDSGASRNMIGGTNVADRNVISGGACDGISFKYEGTERNLVYNNIIGLAPDGYSRRLIYVESVDIDSHAAYNVIGGTEPGQRNVIGGAQYPSVEISHFRLTIENRIVGNYINTDVTGEIADANQKSQIGVMIEDGVGNNIVHSNVIGNADISGVDINGRYTVGNRVYNNLIGISPSGKNIGNRRMGVRVWYQALDSQIGPGNVITNNPIGVQVLNVDNTGHTITRNSIYGNSQLGISFGSTAVPNLNDLGDADGGPNRKLNFPVIASAQPGEVLGTACPGCTVEVFISDRGAGAYGQGKTFVGSALVDADGTFNVAASGLEAGQWVTATATDTESNTSEFALNAPVTAGRTTALAADAFSRTTTDGLGSADLGGAYTLSGTAADFDVANGYATFSNPAGTNRGAVLLDAPALNTDHAVRVATDKVAAGGSLYTYLAARRVDGSSEYQGRLRFDPSGKAYLHAIAAVNSVVTNLGAPVLVPGITHTPNAVYRLRMQVMGTNPTTISLKAWPDADAEPANWQYSATDATPALQKAGVVALRTYISNSITNAPVVFALDDFAVAMVGEPGAPISVPTPDPTLLAVDQFERVLSDNWGSARPGGGWVTDGVIGDFDVAGGAGQMLVPAVGNMRGALLTWNNTQDANMSVVLRTDKVATGSGQYAYMVARRIGAGNEYRMRVRITPDGKVRLQAVRVIGGVETAIGVERAAANLVHAPNVAIRLRMQVSGVNPTTINMRAWADGQPEPTTWTNTQTDTTTTLQQPGALGLRSYLPGSATNAAVLFSYDDFRATTLQP
jgi:CSLREA domain-containing protein